MKPVIFIRLPDLHRWLFYVCVVDRDHFTAALPVNPESVL